MKNSSNNPESSFHSSWSMTKLMVFSLLIFLTYISYSIKFVSHSSPCNNNNKDQSLGFTTTTHLINHSQSELPVSNSDPPEPEPVKTNISHIVFGIAASAKLWNQRKNYIKLWWKPDRMKGVVWLDRAVSTDPRDERVLPPLMISGNTSRFKYKNPKGLRSAIRISRIISETLRMRRNTEEEGVRWFVMGDDDTVFVAENLVRVLGKYDHEQFYYIGSSSESHLQNIHFSYSMAYGGGGFAISYPLAKQLEKMQDRCIQRYPGLYGSDDRIQACMAELGVPLTREQGFHQFDVYGSLFGLLTAHPIAPLVSLHHLDVVQPIFPDTNRVKALERLKGPMELDSAGLMQQSICYDKSRSWTISISWGYAVQIFRGIFSVRDMEMPARTFLNWYQRADYTGYAFNTRPFSRNTCQKPFAYYLSKATYDSNTNRTTTEYVLNRTSNMTCKWKMPDPSRIQTVEVYKRPDPYIWDKAPRRNCCRILPTKKKGTLLIDVGVCNEDEVVELR
ncbi:hypothetical protein PanWU01x14_098620 [Parasponia andersonii]|uniref:Fringe-like n=1 Tax=Parasponia andersonii TaxID=3476 RepID=A0A2P5D487_PARAD|nr:hypothetical protein PanWU01x14_098620 [Parasponia andersonii]